MAEETKEEMKKEEIDEEIKEEITEKQETDIPDTREPAEKAQTPGKNPEPALSREDQILSRIKDEDLMKYLTMEHKKAEMQYHAKEAKEKRIFHLVRLLISLAAIVAVVFLLKDNPTVLVNILYIIGIIVVLWILKNPQEKDSK